MTAHDIRHAGDSDQELWDGYVRARPEAGLYHLFGWRDVIRGAYGHNTYYLLAVRGASAGARAGEAVGVLPLVHLKHVVFGNSLVSLPFVDGGGILAESADVEKRLLAEAVALGRRLGANRVELRCERPVEGCERAILGGGGLPAPAVVAKRTSKVRMVLRLPASSAALVKSFKSKLRSQINRPLKEGCTSSVGGAELLADFYRVFLLNMRDLGSPVHSPELMRRALSGFAPQSRIVVVYSEGAPVASGMVMGFNGVLRNPWASADRRYASMSPNMLLYLRMLEFACDQDYREFDFGRSTRGEGTYRFKEQWGAAEAPLHWYFISPDGTPLDPDRSDAERFGVAARCWRRLPLAVTQMIGPRIRKHIGL